MGRSPSRLLKPGGDAGLKGLIGEGACSFPPLERMAKDSEDDLGIFLSGLLGGSEGCWVS